MRSFYNAACELIDRHVNTRPDKTAIYHGSEIISYGSLQERMNRFGNMLKELGVLPGERIVIALPDCPECIFAFLGAVKYGAWPVLLSPQLSKDTYEFILNDSTAIAVVTAGDSNILQADTPDLRHHVRVDDESFARMLEEASSELDAYASREDDITFMLYTSGSTGNPKGVPHRHRDMVFTAEAYAGGVLGMSENDICYSASKLFFAYGLGNSLSFPLFHGASVVLYPHACTPADFIEILSQYRPTLFFGVPTLYNLLLQYLDQTVSFESLRLCVSAGEALPAPVYTGWKDSTGLEILDGIGSTEALHIFISNRQGSACPGATGFLVPPYEAKIVDDGGNSISSGQPGLLLIRGLSTAPFYWNQPEKTSQTMLEDGWLQTGDIFVEEAGCYTYQGRADDMFKVAGNWVSTSRVEHAIREHPAVFECAVTCRTFEGFARPVASVVLTPGILQGPRLAGEIRSHVMEKLPGYMCPARIEFCAELPKTETGKIQRFRLRT
ncbi:MAG: benzoate-CoA ligase family protein [Syntrophobacteraceae bacterium]|jgi:benzoate-CoA ligase